MDVAHHRLTQARQLRGWSQKDLAEQVLDAGGREHVNVATSKKTVSRWEHGQVPDVVTQELLVKVFNLPEGEHLLAPWPLWLPAPDIPELYYPWTPRGTVEVLADSLRSGRMDRRGFVILSGVTLTTLLHDWLITEPEIVHAVTGSGRRVSTAMIGRIDERIADLQRADDTLGGGDLIGEAEAHLSLVTRLLSESSYTEAQGIRLNTQAADLARMAGWMRFDAGQHAAAQRYFHAALRSAHTSGDRLLGANILAFAAIQQYSVGNPHDADRMVRTAQAAARGRSTPTVDAMLHARQARALAKTGDARRCYHALNQAADCLNEGTSDDDPPWAYWVNRAEVDMLTGSCMLDLGDPARAQQKFTEADTGYGPGYVRTHALYLTRMATAQLQQKDLDRACDSAGQALSLTEHISSTRSTDHIRDFVELLAPYRTEPTARSFLDRARTLLSV
ncbi:helix-turn-helix transcriptional regulator [Nonomuraea sp. NPDC048901]|uniref:helix-turn-helix domain-containing protein n=1 Tax=Nonomuraea sp. NPDC048901 TaxID=3155627 RepID=UPI00341161D0